MSAGVAGGSVRLHALHELLCTVLSLHGSRRPLYLDGRGLGTAVGSGGDHTHIGELGLVARHGLIPRILAGVADLGLVQHMDQVGPVQVFVGKAAEHEVNDGCGRLDVRMVHHAGGFELGEHELLHELLQGHAVLQANGYRDGEGVHQAAKGGSLLGQVDEDLAQGAVSVFAGTQEQSLAVDLGLLGEAPALGGQGFALHDLGELALQFGILRSGHALLKFIQEFLHGEFAHIQ